MVQNTKTVGGAPETKFKIAYAVGIGSILIISLGHVAYAFAAYDALNEPALWFSSGALAIIFNAGLNTLCLKEGTKLNQVIALVANLSLLMFSIVLAVEIREIQAICFAVAIAYTAAIGYSHNRHWQKRKKLTGSATCGVSTPQ